MSRGGPVDGGTMGMLYFLDIRPRDLRMAVLFVVICWMPLLSRAAPFNVLPSNWSVVNRLSSNYPADDTNVIVRHADKASFLVVLAGHDFVFGFFSPSPGASSMLAIALNPEGYSYGSRFQVVWSANRNSPVGENATLSLSGGNLVLRDNDTRVVWSTNVTAGKSISSVQMKPSGNLVFLDGNNRTLWKSFKHPTDTLLPHAILTHKMALVAGSSPTNGSEGSYRMVLESKGLVLYATLGSSSSALQPYWMSSATPLTFDELVRSEWISKTWTFDEVIRSEANGSTVQACMTVPERGRRRVGSYYRRRQFAQLEVCYHGMGGKTCDDTAFAGTRRPIENSYHDFIRLDYDGVLRWYFYDKTAPADVPAYTLGQWNNSTLADEPTDICLHPGYCGPYGICCNGGQCRCPTGLASNIFQFRNEANVHEGCNPTWNSNFTNCSNENLLMNLDKVTDVHLLQQPNVTYFSNQYLPPAAVNGSSDECQNMCLRNCSCAAAFFWNNSTLSECFLVSELLSMVYTTPIMSSGQYSAFIKYYQKAKLTHGFVQNLITGWKLGVIISSGIFLLLTLCAVSVVMAVIVGRSVGSDVEDEAFLESLPGLPPRFSFKELDVATKHFSKVLGEGGFGTVYEGSLPDGNMVAVKRLGGSRQGQKEFRAEVATIGGINHLRLVRLWGFCAEGAHRMLVYECMHNGSLDRWLFREAVLEWAVRYQIAVDTAQGLSYLHRDCRQKIIHLDVKPQNILLDDRFRAKVSDFGMSKLFDEEMTEVVTRMRGTPGYLAPEWLLQTGITVKCDVYSYGMVLLEIVSGRKNIDVNASHESWYFPAWAVQRMQEQAWKEIVDVRLEESLSLEELAQVKKVVMIAMWCIQDTPRLRPTMATVAQMLEGVVEVDDPPLQYDFLAIGSREGPPILSNSSSGSSASHDSSASQSSD